MSALKTQAVKHPNSAIANITLNVDGSIEFAVPLATLTDLATRLSAANNLSDIEDQTMARLNLGCGAIATYDPSQFLPVVGTAHINGGFTNGFNELGSITSGIIHLDPTVSNHWAYTNNGAHTVIAPTSDCEMFLIITQGQTPGGIWISGVSNAVSLPVASKFLLHFIKMGNTCLLLSYAFS